MSTHGTNPVSTHGTSSSPVSLSAPPSNSRSVCAHAYPHTHACTHSCVRACRAIRAPCDRRQPDRDCMRQADHRRAHRCAAVNRRSVRAQRHYVSTAAVAPAGQARRTPPAAAQSRSVRRSSRIRSQTAPLSSHAAYPTRHDVPCGISHAARCPMWHIPRSTVSDVAYPTRRRSSPSGTVSRSGTVTVRPAAGRAGCGGFPT